MDVRIGKVENEIVVTDGVGPLAPREVQKIVQLVLEHLRHEEDRRRQHERDTEISNRVYTPGM